MRRLVIGLCIVWLGIGGAVAQGPPPLPEPIPLETFGTAWDMAWRPQHDTLAVATRDTVWLLDEQLQVLDKLPIEGAYRLYWSPDGVWLAVDKVVDNGEVWDIEADALVATIPYTAPYGEGGHSSLAWSPDGSQLAFVQWYSEGLEFRFTLAIWHKAHGEQVAAWALTDYPSAIAWHPHDPYQMALGYPTRIDIIDPATGAISKSIPDAHLIPPLVWRPDGILVASSTPDAKMVAVYDMAEGRYVRSLFNAGKQLRVACWGVGGLVTLGGGEAIVWDAETGRVIAQVEAQLVTCEPDGTRLAYIHDERVWLWTIGGDGEQGHTAQ